MKMVLKWHEKLYPVAQQIGIHFAEILRHKLYYYKLYFSLFIFDLTSIHIDIRRIIDIK